MPPATTTSCGRPESSFCQFLALGNTGKVEELQARKDRLAALMTATNDYTNWCED